MSSNVETTVIQLIENSSYTIQLDESTDVANLTVLLVFAWQITESTIQEELHFSVDYWKYCALKEMQES
jgi:hypothetical protein